MADAFRDSMTSLKNFSLAAACHGLGFPRELSDEVIEQTLPHLDGAISRIQARLRTESIVETPLVSPRPRLRSSGIGWAEYGAPVNTYGCLGNGCLLPQSWAYIFFEQEKTAAKWKSQTLQDEKPYRGNDAREPFPLSSRQILELWWKAPSDSSAGTGDEGLISSTGRIFYRSETLLLMFEAMRTAKTTDGEIDPYDAYNNFVELSGKYDPDLFTFAQIDRDCFKRKVPSSLPPY